MFSLAFIKALDFAVAFGAKCNPNAPGNGGSFFGFPTWYKYFNTQNDGRGDALGGCTPHIDFSNGPMPALKIGLAMIDILLFLGGIAAVITIIIAGISYIMAAGAPDKITSARRRIQNGLIGLAIVVIASATVSFIGNTLTK